MKEAAPVYRGLVVVCVSGRACSLRDAAGSPGSSTLHCFQIQPLCNLQSANIGARRLIKGGGVLAEKRDTFSL